MTYPANDFRPGYLNEARECMRASNRILKKYPDSWHSIPEFWANLFGAIANSNMAGVSDMTAIGFVEKENERREEQRRIRELLDDKLNAKLRREE